MQDTLVSKTKKTSRVGRAHYGKPECPENKSPDHLSKLIGVEDFLERDIQC